MMKSDDGANSDGDVEEQPPPPSAFVSDISSMIQKPMDDSIQVSTIPTSTQDNDDSISEKKRCYNGWGKGIIDDYKRTVKTHWKEEMTNFSLKTVAVSFFLFFACIAPAMYVFLDSSLNRRINHDYSFGLLSIASFSARLEQSMPRRPITGLVPLK